MPIPDDQQEGNIQLNNLHTGHQTEHDYLTKLLIVNVIIAQLRTNMNNRPATDYKNKLCVTCQNEFSATDQPIALLCHEDHVYCVDCIRVFLMHKDNLASRKVCVHTYPKCYIQEPNIRWEADL